MKLLNREPTEDMLRAARDSGNTYSEMKHCIHAFTETRYKDYPGYISINKEPNGKITITVRAPESQTPQTITVTPEQLEHLACDVLDFLHREQV